MMMMMMTLPVANPRNPPKENPRGSFRDFDAKEKYTKDNAKFEANGDSKTRTMTSARKSIGFESSRIRKAGTPLNT